MYQLSFSRCEGYDNLFGDDNSLKESFDDFGGFKAFVEEHRGSFASSRMFSSPINDLDIEELKASLCYIAGTEKSLRELRIKIRTLELIELEASGEIKEILFEITNYLSRYVSGPSEKTLRKVLIRG